jgi:3-oxoacyl-[acyl-carrier protein] reductase
MHRKNKSAIVTGAARGIGRAIALSLSREEYRVALWDIDLPSGTAASIRKQEGECVAMAVDVSRIDAVEKATDEVIEAFTTVDVLVNNAGIIHRGSFTDLSPANWRQVLEVNLNGTFNCCYATVPRMIEQGGGKIINITSVAGLMGDITASPAYGTSKGAINTLTRSLARQLARHNITVNAVAPHAIETDMSAQWSEEKRKSIIAGIPLGRLGRPEEVAAAAVFLASPGADFITGEVLNINGGFLMV